MIGERSAKEGALTPLEGRWLPTIIIFGIGIFLTWMATRDSSIFNQELYLNYMKKGLNFIFVTHRMARPEIEYKATKTDLSPERMTIKIEELSRLIKLYLEGDFRKKMRFSKIWYKKEDAELQEIGKNYDRIFALLKQSDMYMIKETVDEYPIVALHNYKIKNVSNWHVLVAAVIFPIWIYLFLKAWIQKYSLRSELINIMSTNRNLVNELIVNIHQEILVTIEDDEEEGEEFFY